MRCKRKPDQRGAALIEFAIIIPVFMTLVMGMLEFGLVFKDYLTVANTTRAGARVASAAGIDASADYSILQAVKAAVGGVPTSSIVKIVVFKSDANGTLPAACKTTAVNATCNVYTAADMSLTQAQLTASGKSNFWPSTTGRDDHQATANYIGVWVRVDHAMATKMFGSTFTLTDATVMRIEPRRT